MFLSRGAIHGKWFHCWITNEFPFYVGLTPFAMRDKKFHLHPSGNTFTRPKEEERYISWSQTVSTNFINKVKIISLDPCLLCLCLNVNTFTEWPWADAVTLANSDTAALSPKSCNILDGKEDTDAQEMTECLRCSGPVINAGDSHWWLEQMKIVPLQIRQGSA